jgi:hypothetical protein
MGDPLVLIGVALAGLLAVTGAVLTGARLRWRRLDRDENPGTDTGANWRPSDRPNVVAELGGVDGTARVAATTRPAGDIAEAQANSARHDAKS